MTREQRGACTMKTPGHLRDALQVPMSPLAAAEFPLADEADESDAIPMNRRSDEGEHR
jgi:hypothetical protein